MELVSSSKLRKARKELIVNHTLLIQLNNCKKYCNNLRIMVQKFIFKRKKSKNKCYIVIAGDRGLAGGLQSNVYLT